MSSSHQPMEEDDVDDFLYGSDAPEDNYGSTTKSANKKISEEDEEIYEQFNNETLNKSDVTGKAVADDRDMETPGNDNAMEEDEEEQEEDSDDDLDIILEAEQTDQITDSQKLPSERLPGETSETDKTNNPLVNIKPGQSTKETSQQNTTDSTAATSGTTAMSAKASGGVNLEAIGEYNGQPITDVDLDNFEDKPWRKPGADITDYFNYGFNEVTWRAYCAKQKAMRDKKPAMNVNTGTNAANANASNKQNEMSMQGMQGFMGNMDMPDFMKMGMMMPMMEGGMPMGMMNPMMNPLMGLPPHQHPPPPPHPHGPPPPMAGGPPHQVSGSGSSRMMNPNYGGGNPASNSNGGSNNNSPRGSRR